MRREGLTHPISLVEQIADFPTEVHGDGLTDDEIRMLFLCCHPDLSANSQLILVLYSLGGLKPFEIARALLMSETAVSQRISRSKRTLAGCKFEAPQGQELETRFDVVLNAIYLLFNEGYFATSGESIHRGELCAEAVSLAERLALSSLGNQPVVHALLSLLFFQWSRQDARWDGGLIRLEQQDRSKWNQERIQKGKLHLNLASRGDRLTRYHCEAAIASVYSLAPSFEETDWKTVLVYYEDLLSLGPNPVAELNRLVAFSKAHGPAAALERLAEIDDSRLLQLSSRHAVEAWLRSENRQFDLAAAAYLHAAALTENQPEKQFLMSQANECLSI
jgi:RNA polymerase sigma-70 factor (ECF subfamily)